MKHILDYYFIQFGYEKGFTHYLDSVFHVGKNALMIDLTVILAGLGSLALTCFTGAAELMGVSSVFLSVLIALLTMDLITGLVASVKNGKEITSRRGVGILVKTGTYLALIVTTYTLYKEFADHAQEQFLSYALRYLYFFVLINVVFWTIFSIDENLSAVGIHIPFMAGIKKLFNLVNRKIDDKVKEGIDIVDGPEEEITEKKE